MELCISQKEKREFLKEQTKCPVCQADLDITIEFIHEEEIKEEARCTQCMALSYIKQNTLH